MEVRFYDSVPDEKLRFAVVIARHAGRWVFCKHRARDTWEAPGDHREPGEAVETTARRELHEETGAEEFALRPVCAYSVTGMDGAGEESFGMLYAAEIERFGALPPLEIERILLAYEPPGPWTYPEVHPKLMAKAAELFP